jgi:hypothetical protein
MIEQNTPLVETLIYYDCGLFLGYDNLESYKQIYRRLGGTRCFYLQVLDGRRRFLSPKRRRPPTKI